MATAQGESQPKLRYLDGLRGWAALAVVLDHFVFAFLPFAINQGGTWHHLGEARLHDSWLYAFINGSYAVSIFFILSGIVLSASFFRTGSVAGVQASAVKRYVRLALPAGISVLLACALMKLGWLWNVPASEISGSPWWSHFWQFTSGWNQAAYHGLIDLYVHGADTNSYNPVLWTLQIELWGSFLVYFTLLAFGKLRARWVIYCLLALLTWQSFYLGFVIGIVAADLYFHGRLNRLPHPIQRFGWAPLLLVGIVFGSLPEGSLSRTVFAGLSELPEPTVSYIRLLIHMLGGLATLLAVLLSPLLQWLLTRRLSAFMGRISFSLYLTHFLVLGSYGSYLFSSLNPARPYGWRVAVTLIGCLAVIIPVAYVYSKFIDEPAIRLSGAIYRRWFTQATPANPAIRDNSW